MQERREALGGGCGSVCGPEDDSSSKRSREGSGMRVRKAGWLGRAGRQCPFKEKWLVKLAKSGARERKQTEARAEKVANTYAPEKVFTFDPVGARKSLEFGGGGGGGKEKN